MPSALHSEVTLGGVLQMRWNFENECLVKKVSYCWWSVQVWPFVNAKSANVENPAAVNWNGRVDEGNAMQYINDILTEKSRGIVTT